MAIDTIFYFANNQAEYDAAEIASRTISFVPRESGRGNIYKNNVRYGGVDVEFDAEAVKTIFKNWQNDPNSTDKPEAYTLPTASTTIKGGIKIGKALSMNGETMDVDFSGIQASDISGLQALIETIVRGMGLGNGSARFRIQNGILQVSYDNGTTWSSIGNVGGGTDYAITQFTTSGNSIRLVQTNGFSGSVDISSVVTNIINTLYPEGPQGGHTKTTVAITDLMTDVASTNKKEIARFVIDGGSPISIYAPKGSSTPVNPDDPNNDDPTVVDRIEAVENDIAQKWSNLDNRIDEEVEDLFKESLWIQENFPIDQIWGNSNFGISGKVDNYLLTIGLWTVDDQGNTITQWSKIYQDINSIETRVAAVEAGADPTDLTELEASLKQYIDSETNTAFNELSTLYARKEAEEIVEWLYSGLTQGSNESKTWNDLVSAARAGNYGAIGGIYTKVQKIPTTGDLIATTNLVSEITEKKGDIVTALSSAGVLTSADLNNANSTLYSKIGQIAASVDTLVKKNASTGVIESTVKIDADQIQLNGNTFVTNLAANSAFIGALSANTTFTDSLFANRALIGEYQSRNDGIYCKINPGSSYSDLKFQSSSQKYVDVSANNLNGGWLKLYKNDTFGTALTADMLEIGGDVDRTSDGDVAIRLLAASGSSSLNLKSTNTSSNDYITIDSGSGIRYGKVISGTTYTGNIGAGIWSLSDGVNTYSIMASGVSTTSDMRLKLVVDDVNLTASQIAEAPIFNYKTSTTSEQTFIGTSAQYWETVLPNTVKEINGYLSLDYTKVNTASVINLAKEVVTLKQEKATLVERIEALEARLQLIENQLNAQ